MVVICNREGYGEVGEVRTDLWKNSLSNKFLDEDELYGSGALYVCESMFVVLCVNCTPLDCMDQLYGSMAIISHEKTGCQSVPY